MSIDATRYPVRAHLDFPDELRKAWLIERQFSTKQGVQDDATRPDVNLWSSVSTSAVEKLWCCIIWRTAGRFQKLPWYHPCSESKIGDLHVEIVAHEDVLGLYVTMHNHVSMTMVDTTDYLLENSASIYLRHPPLSHNVVKQVPVGSEFEHHANCIRHLKHVSQPRHVPVLNGAVQVDFAQKLPIRSFFADHFERKLLTSLLVLCQLHCAEGASAQDDILDSVLVHGGGRWLPVWTLLRRSPAPYGGERTARRGHCRTDQ
mmetsp:Transcript_154187/g.287446  ORF Transcript_154187/g.287446 Transcript_154187/m.287446 type:complete len:260 (-) Transcript_154187:29-808(-)